MEDYKNRKDDFNMNLCVRGVDAAAVVKIDEEARKRGMSRNAFLRACLESLAVLGDLKELEGRTSASLHALTAAMQECARTANQAAEDAARCRMLLENQNEEEMLP